MRRRLYLEGRSTNDGRRLEATRWPEDRIPLLLAPDTDDGHGASKIVGWVDKIQREDDGWVTGDLHTRVNPEELFCEPDFDNAEHRDLLGGVLVIRAARLRSVHLGKRPCWDGMEQ